MFILNKAAVFFLSFAVAVISCSAVDAAWVQTNGPAGGNIEAVALAPNNANTVYAGGRGGTLYKSVDAGANWVGLANTDLTRIIHQILIPANSPQTVYVSTGTLYKSTDGGQTLAQVADVGGVNQLAVSPNNYSVLAAASPDGNLYLTADGFANVTPVAGIGEAGATLTSVAFGSEDTIWVGTAANGEGRLYSSTDNGVTWTEIPRATLNPKADTDVTSIFVDPADASGNTVYVGYADVFNEVFDAAADSYLLKTTDGGAGWTALHVANMDSTLKILGREDDSLFVGSGALLYRSDDGGGTWTDISPPERMADGAIYMAMDNETLYVPSFIGTGIFKSTDNGATWTNHTNGLKNVSVSLLAVPRNPGFGTLYAASVNGEGTFRTTDNGETWTNTVFNGITHRWTDELQVSPHDDSTVWQVADVGEIFRTTDGGDIWTRIINPYGPGFRYGSIYALASAPSALTTVYALRNGFGIYKSINSGEFWSFLHHSEIDYSYSLAVHPTDPDTVYSGFIPKPFQDYAMVRKTADGGSTWYSVLQVDASTGITSVAIAPTAPATVYAGSTGRGGSVMKSTDSGATWQKANSHFTFTNIHVFAADPVDSDTAYAGVWGGGTWKTADGGVTWARLANDPTISASAILIHPTNSDIIYIADRTAPKIYRSTDGGATWETFFDAGAGYYRVMTASLSPANPDVLYASVFLYGGPMSGNLFKITSGNSAVITGDLPRLPVSLAPHPQDENTLYAVTHMYGVYKTTDNGTTWSELGGLPQIGFNGIVINPAMPDTLYLVGGCDVRENFISFGVATQTEMNTVYRSTDGGATWINLDDGSLGAASGSIKGLAVSPLDADVLFVGSLNGVLRSTDNGTSWTNISAGLNYTHTAGAAISGDGARLYIPTLGGGVFAGAVNQDDHSVTWEDASSLVADIYHVLIRVNPVDANIVYASAYPGGVFKSTDGGATWQECNFGMASFAVEDPKRQGYYSFAISDSAPDTLYLGLYGVGMYKSVNGAATWRRMNGAGHEMTGKPITDILVNPADADLVTVASESGVFQTIDGGGNWSAVNTDLDTLDIRTLALRDSNRVYAGTRGYEVYMMEVEEDKYWRQLPGFGQYGTFWPIWDGRPLYQYTSLLFDPVDPDIIYIGTFPAGIFKSTDGGVSWRESNIGWSNDGVFSLVFRPGNTNIIYAGTYNGVNRSQDAGGHWEVWDNGWPDEQWVFSIDFDPRNPDIMYACSKNGENEGQGREDFRGTVMKTVDGGATWYSITNGIELDNEFYKIIVDRHNPDTLYLASQHEGVFVSTDAGGSWTAWNDGLTNLKPGTNGNNVTNTMLLSPDGNYLYFGSNGSGVFRRFLPVDTDGDNLADTWEQTHFGSLGRDGSGDFDADGLTDREEYRHLTDPTSADSDNDGMPDLWEIDNWLNPIFPDGSADVDNDTYTNLQEYNANTSPTDPGSTPLPGDIDGSGSIDLADAILAFRIITDSALGNASSAVDINDDGLIGTEEAIYILQTLSGLR